MNPLITLNSLITAYLYKTIDLKTLRESSAALWIAAGEKGGDATELRMANQLIGDFSDMDEGYMSEAQLRNSLAASLLSRTAFSSRPTQIKLQPFYSKCATRTNTSIQTRETKRIEFFGTGRALARA